MLKQVANTIQSWRSQRRDTVQFEKAWTILISEQDVTLVSPDGARESIAWGDMLTVDVHTNDSGPWGYDVWWVLAGTTSFLAIPQGATGEKELLDRLIELPGFDHTAFSSALRCTHNAIFKCWSGGPSA